MKILQKKYFLFLAVIAIHTATADPGVLLRVKRAGAPEAAPTPEAMEFMMEKPSRRIHDYRLDNIVPVQSGRGSRFNWYHGGWQNPVYLAEFSGTLNIQNDGDFTFEIRSYAPVYFWLNDKLILQQNEFFSQNPRNNPEPPAITGETIKLKSGPAKLRIITMCRDAINLKLFWKNPKSPKDFTPVSNSDWLETPSPPNRENARYSFSTVKGAFSPVTDESGEIKRIDYSPQARPLIEYRLSADITGIPAVCDENERISPEIQGYTNAPDSVPVTYEATVITESQDYAETNTFSSTITFNKGWGRLALPEYTVQNLRSIKWRTSHCGITITSGHVRFLPRPYTIIPDEIRNDALYSNGIRIVPITSITLRTPNSALQTPNIVVLDGFISSTASGGAAIGKYFDNIISNELSETSYRRIIISENLISDPVPFANRNLLPFLAFREIKEGSTVIIAPEIKGAYYGESFADFKKNLLAETAFLRDTKRCKLVLLTPPEGILDESEPHDARDYAAVIHLAADIEGAEIIDLYTLDKTQKIRCADKERHCLSEDGVKLATKYIR